MALPRWITPEGQLGIVPELDYYEFNLDAYDESGGTLVFSRVSGRLPLGLQVITTGKIAGIPVSELGGDQNVEYTFTIRVQNSSTGELADRTFKLTITNVAPPVISFPTRNSDLGLYLDGSELNIQLDAVEFLPGANIVWSITSGELPPGLTLTSTGVLSGVLEPIVVLDPNADPDWDQTSWGEFVWDFSIRAINKSFEFTVEAFDGVNYDYSTYTIEVFPRSALTADNIDVSVDRTILGTGIPLTIDLGNRHNPIITTTQTDLPPLRENSYFSFKISARDLDDDVLQFSVPNLIQGSFDEQSFSNTALSYPYVASTVTGNELSVGIFPQALVTISPDAVINANIANVTITANATVSGNIYLGIMTVNTIYSGQLAIGQELSGAGVLSGTTISGFLSGTGGTGTYLVDIPQNLTSTNLNASSGEQVSSSEINLFDVNFQPGDIIKVINSSNQWELATVTSSTTLRITGNSIPSISPSNYLTQDSSLANITVASVGDTLGTINLQGNITFGNLSIIQPTYQVTFSGNIVANVGQHITQALSGANARVIDSNVTTKTANVLFISGVFTNGTGNIQISGLSVAAYPTANVKDIRNTLITANVGDYITQTGYSGNATVTANVSDSLSVPVTFNSGTFNRLGGNIRINGNDANVWITDYSQTSIRFTTPLTIGQYIVQPSTGANAVVTANLSNGTRAQVKFLTNTFTVGSGNLTINGANINAYPSSVVCNTSVRGTYNSAGTFDINNTDPSGYPKVSGTPLLYSNITSVVSVGVTLSGTQQEGTVGFDESKFDQGTLSLPLGLTLDQNSGWITGVIPNQNVSKIIYPFEVLVYKKDYPNYQDSQLYNLIVYDDLNNRIDWITPSDLGNVTTGKVSDLFVYATSPLGKTILYELANDSYQRIPQGLSLTLTGLISGRVSFSVFSLDKDQTTFTDNGVETTFDRTYRFTVTARDINNTVSENRTFTLRVRQFDKIPYENLYLKALPTKEQRDLFVGIVNDKTIFPPEKIYRTEDPWFGVAKDIRSLFLAGLSPSQLSEYAAAVDTNHFKKRLNFGQIKTAQALDSNFNVKYEVIYIELEDENSYGHENGQHTAQYSTLAPTNTIDLTGVITNPYYDITGNTYTVAYPNSFNSMENVVSTEIGFQDKGALPDWMTSKQPNGRQLGFVHAVVLAYAKPGESDLIAYRLQESGFKFNTIDFTIDRYQLDNILTTNFDITANAFITSSETTFDRYTPITGDIVYLATVDYAVSVPYEKINAKKVSDIQALSIDGAFGLDGVTNFRDGDTLVFARQEYAGTFDYSDTIDYNLGWSDTLIQWDDNGWASGASIDGDVDVPYDPNLIPPNLPGPGGYDFTPGQKWDESAYVPGYIENLLDPLVPNKRIGIWRINIDEANVVSLTYIQDIEYFDAVYVRKGFKYGQTNIFYDNVVKQGNNIPNYSIVNQTVNVTATTFDGNGTRFYDYRDTYNVPEQGDKYIKYKQTGVFT